MPPTRKAYAYIVRHRPAGEGLEGTSNACGREFLVFRHRDFPEAGVQVPKGTMHPDETPAAAVLREAHEETGLTTLTLVRPLAADSQIQADGAVHERHFFELSAPADTPDSWEHVVTGAGDDHGLVFSYLWACSATEAGLWPGFGDYLDLVLG
jgi:8-oxo-dGTP pyrophosphatase MutT (NUDIX family)